jgi:hypothetical protein
MEKLFNPYSPGAGMPPFELAGRGEDIELIDVAIQRVAMGLAVRSMVFYGLRGVGKTVLLREMYSRTKKAEWISIYIESDPAKDLRALLSERLEDVIADIAKPGVGETILKAVKTTLSFIKLDIDSGGGMSLGADFSGITGSNAATGNFEGDIGRLIRDLSETTVKDNKGVAIFVDEAQDLSSEDLRAINMLVHRANQEGYRIVVVMAGLPSLPAKLADSTSYAERLYMYRELKALSENAAARALTVPSEARDVRWEADAIASILKSTGCFSYFVQEYGYAVWDVAESSPITLDDVVRSESVAQRALDEGFFRTRWDRATDAQKAYLQAMAHDANEPSATSEIADRLHTVAARLAPRRSELIAKGLIYSPNRGYVAFTVPKMSEFIRRQSTD